MAIHHLDVATAGLTASHRDPLVQRLFAARPIGCCELRCFVAACVLGAVPWITWLWMELTR